MFNSDSSLDNIAPNFQVGRPELPPVGQHTYFELMKHWLKDCNEKHDCSTAEPSSLPKRLIDVGNEPYFKTEIHLYETHASEEGRYVALSHPWGDPKQHPPFCTYTSNLEDHKRSIDITKLPKTFQDAIKVTRELGVKYLWIDSLCIVQGEDGDWLEESKQMEHVFHSAYCVIAATCARGSADGFLASRPVRDYVAVQKRKEILFYICESIDDFHGEVLDGSLNKRGWVLQERVLARRTIYFAEKQTYWQCGHGIRCETLAKMQK